MSTWNNGNGMTVKQATFVKRLTEGKTQKEAALLAGYKPNNVDVVASNLMRNIKIIKALDRVGITDDMLSKNLKQHITDGMGVKATADTSLRAIDLATRLKGYQQPEPKEQTNNQTNIYINELKQMNDTDLEERLQTLTRELKVVT